jgi:hypothetical protein
MEPRHEAAPTLHRIEGQLFTPSEFEVELSWSYTRAGRALELVVHLSWAYS